MNNSESGVRRFTVEGPGGVISSMKGSWFWGWGWGFGEYPSMRGPSMMFSGCGYVT